MKYTKYGHVCAFETAPEKIADEICVERCLRKLRESCYVSSKHPYCQTYFRSKMAIQYEVDRQKRLGMTFMVHPYSVFRMRWEYAIFWVFLLQQILHPTSRIFDWTNGYILTFLTAIDLIGWLDICIHCFTGYKDPYSYEVVLKRTRIWK